MCLVFEVMIDYLVDFLFMLCAFQRMKLLKIKCCRYQMQLLLNILFEIYRFTFRWQSTKRIGIATTHDAAAFNENINKHTQRLGGNCFFKLTLQSFRTNCMPWPG